MASEFSKQLAIKISHIMHTDPLAVVLDIELQEVREALELLQNLPYQKPPCFCRVKWIVGEHDGPCQRARALMEKIAIREGKPQE